ncbi:23S rRNA (pseudouridine(1915)-N(3))-methyltransferase RlmH [Sulfurospirillum arcachonense]|uniref:23S rRNA (pseudouridine(1915)-N(3))-methyltransferase RlmH n=1 Tax=Sulfurospirillum arcachonense TaxID=57666 RepID=UPI0004686525|nr:23S rRNA (pseudouridine(1915)-N(3))-methyltransferase RlmH [Sulfurospirillum arcachonense]
MNIKVFSIEKSSNKTIDVLNKEYIKMISKNASIEDIVVFNKQIALAQTKGEKEARDSYTKAYETHLKGYNIALDVEGKQCDSFEFSEIFDNAMNINFFIGGAYGFDKEFLSKTQKVISLSKLTYAHKIAKVVLYEQIYRGLCIKNNHPYHK